MATSGTYSFVMNIQEVIEDALDMIGGEQTLGSDPLKARRALNQLFQDLQNRSVNLWTLEEGVTTVTDGVSEYALTSATNDLLSAVVRTSASGSVQDIELLPIGYEEWLSIPNKEQDGRPTQIFVRRDRDYPSFVLWPVPDQTYEIKYWRIRSLQDVGGPTNTPDVPKRFLPVLPLGLAYYMGIRKQFADPKMMAAWERRLDRIKEEYEIALSNAQGEDRSRVDMKVVPRINMR